MGYGRRMGEQAPGGAGDTTDFGFREVDEADKASLVRAVFDSVAPRYDLMNDLMSLGIHRLWKRTMVNMLRPRPGETIVDVAGGTGDIAGRIQERTAGRARVVVCDINRQMVEHGRDRLIDRGRPAGIDWVVGDAERLPLADRVADGYTIAFGIRNVTDRAAALAEARRVLKPGGRMLCLEFGHVATPGLAAVYDAVSFRLLPEIGARVTGDRDAYRYLIESIRRFPPQAEFAATIAEAGLGRVRYRDLSGGIAVLYSAWRL